MWTKRPREQSLQSFRRITTRSVLWRHGSALHLGVVGLVRARFGIDTRQFALTGCARCRCSPGEARYHPCRLIAATQSLAETQFACVGLGCLRQSGRREQPRASKQHQAVTLVERNYPAVSAMLARRRLSTLHWPLRWAHAPGDGPHKRLPGKLISSKRREIEELVRGVAVNFTTIRARWPRRTPLWAGQHGARFPGWFSGRTSGSCGSTAGVFLGLAKRLRLEQEQTQCKEI